MVYERIEKQNPSESGGISPSKLRAILLGLEKKRKEEEEGLDGFGFGSESESDEIGGIRDNAWKVNQQCSSSMESVRDLNLSNSNYRFRSGQTEDPFKPESNFQFHRLTDRAPPRSPLMLPFSKPSPSKWDDAEKWIASPTSSRTGKDGQSKKSGLGGNGSSRKLGTKVVLEAADEPDTKRIDPNQARKEVGRQRDLNSVVDLGAKPDHIFELPVADSPISLNQHDLLTHNPVTLVSPPLTIKSASMRDMGTEMTPMTSQEPSRTGTPVGATTRSPTSSRSLSPIRTTENSTVNVSVDCTGDSHDKELSVEDIKKKTRREILALGQQLGKVSIAAWASKEAEEPNASIGQTSKNNIETRAAAWEEAEKVKYTSRLKQEEIKIQAWENHQNAKAEAKMRQTEVEVERMRARANDRLINQLASVRRKAEEKRAAAEARKNHQATKAAEQVDYIRRTGRVPPSPQCWGWFS